MNNNHFKETDIRPNEFMERQRIMALCDVGRLLLRRKEFIVVNCPACNSSEQIKKFEKFGLSYVMCIECETMYINPRPSPEILEWLYKDSENYAYWNKYIFPPSENARREKIFVPRVDKVLEMCEKFKIKTNSLLEVGAGYGTFCTELRTRMKFKRIVAIEPTPDLAQTCREKGLETIENPIEKIIFNDAEKFDVVVNFEVIEHLFSPKEFILNCRKLIKQSGLLILTCPNVKGFDFIELGQICNSIDHEHLNYFNPDSLSHLLIACGFKVLESQTPGRLDAELVRNKIISGEFDVSQKPFLRKILLENWENIGRKFQDFLAHNGLSSNMWIIARKIDI